MKVSFRFLRFAPIALSLLSCRGERFELGDDDPPPIAPPALLEHCPNVIQGARPFGNDDEMIRSLTGRWYRCRGVADGVLFFNAIEFTYDNRWFALDDDGTGHLVRSRDPARYGRYDVTSPVLIGFVFENGAQQFLTAIFDDARTSLIAIRSTIYTTDVAYVHE